MTQSSPLPTRRFCLGLACLGWLLAALPQPAAAAEGSEAAEDVVLQLVGNMWRVLSADEMAEAERVSAIAETIEAGTDTRLLGRLTLGRSWRELDDDQQKRYLKSFPKFITSTLAGQIVAASEGVGSSLDDHFALIGSEHSGERDTVVQTEITTPKAEALRVDWRFRERHGGLTLIDVLIDGVSLLITKRNEFSAIIEQQSVDQLLIDIERAGA
ncbi:MAG: ABC transporter substrate-binding protein [Alphaproteobacteria bacterium]